jgi:hypothetical protein
MFDRCSRCNEIRYGPKHTCPPAWQVKQDWGDDDDKTIYAIDAKTAAEEYAAKHHSRLDWASVIELLVRAPDGPTWEPYTVEVEAVPMFTARKDKKRQAKPVEVEVDDESEDDDED